MAKLETESKRVVTGIEEIDNVTVHFGFGYLFKVRLAVGRWVSVVVHLMGEVEPDKVRSVLAKELNDKGVKWEIIQYKHNMCYSKYETPDQEGNG